MCFNGAPAQGAHHFISTMIGGGYTFAQSKQGPLATLHNAASLRIGIDPQMKIPFFWGFDLETFRIQKSNNQRLYDHHHGFGAQFILGITVPEYSFWLGGGWGRILVNNNYNDMPSQESSRYQMHGASIGGSLAIYQQKYARVDLFSQLKLVTTDKTWRQRYQYKHLRFFSILMAITIIDI